MSPTDRLREDHKAIAAMLNVLGKMCEMMERGDRVNPDHLGQALDFFKGFADGCHHYKEEKVLFPALHAVGVPKEEGPVAVMLQEHTEGRDHIRRMSEGLSLYTAGDQHAAGAIIRAAKDYIGLLSAHIDKEDHILFLMAEHHLPEEQQRGIGDEFDRLEFEILGTDRDEKYQQLLNRLRTLYH